MSRQSSYRLFLLLAALVSQHLPMAQLPVVSEPHHKVLFENNYLRLLKGSIAVNDTTAAHLHAANSVVVFLSSSTYGIRIIGDKPENSAITTVRPGDMKYIPYGDKPVTHLVWNQTAPVFQFLVVELEHAPTTDTCPTLGGPGITFQWRQKAVTAYALHLSPGQLYRLPSSGCARLLIDITGTITTDYRTLQSGNFAFLPPKKEAAIGGNAHGILLELK